MPTAAAYLLRYSWLRPEFANNRKTSPPPFVDRTWLFVNDVVGEELQPA
jgi:hypothetical protein